LSALKISICVFNSIHFITILVPDKNRPGRTHGQRTRIVYFGKHINDKTFRQLDQVSNGSLPSGALFFGLQADSTTIAPSNILLKFITEIV
jgi:hypothetical protein